MVTIAGRIARATDDDLIDRLVAERKDMRDELRALERAAAGNVIEMASRSK